MAEPREYVGQFSNPYRVVQISGTPDATPDYTAGDVLFRNADGEAFFIPCATLGKEQLADLVYIVVREVAVGGAVVKANIKLHFSRVGGVDWAVPAANAAFSAPADMEDYLGSVDIVTADYEEVQVGGAIGYAIARVPVTEDIRCLLMSAESDTGFYAVPAIFGALLAYPVGSDTTIQFFFRQH